MPTLNLADAKKVTLSLADAKPVSADAPAEPSWYSPIYDFVSQLHSLDPRNIVSGMASTAKLFAPPGKDEMLAASTGPLGLAVARLSPAIAKSQKDLLDKAGTAFKEGDYAAGLRHTLGAVANFMPGMGTRLDEAGEALGKGTTSLIKGDTAKGVDELAVGAGAFVDAAMPMLLSKVPAIRVGSKTPESGVLVLGDRLGVNDAAAITNNRAIRGVQALSDNLTMSGATVAEGARAKTVNALSAEANRLAGARGAASTTPYNAGASLQTAGTSLRDAFESYADAAYSKVREIEALPVNNKVAAFDASGSPLHDPMPLPVDRRAAKTELAPILDQIARPLSQTAMESSSLVKAIRNIVDGPDYAPLSMTDIDLGGLKALARKKGGLAGKAIGKLEDAVEKTLAQAPPEVRVALKAGREATKRKYEVVAAMEDYMAEPVAAFTKATMAHDAGYNHLAAIAKVLPDEMPKLGRAYLDDMIDAASVKGGFEINDAAWWKLGARTKTLLYGDASYVAEIDNFMKLARRLRPGAGSARTAYMGGFAADLLQGYWMHSPGKMVLSEMGGMAVSKLLRSKVGVSALSKGLTVPARSAAAPAIAAQISSLVQGDDEK